MPSQNRARVVLVLGLVLTGCAAAAARGFDRGAASISAPVSLSAAYRVEYHDDGRLYDRVDRTEPGQRYQAVRRAVASIMDGTFGRAVDYTDKSYVTETEPVRVLFQVQTESSVVGARLKVTALVRDSRTMVQRVDRDRHLSNEDPDTVYAVFIDMAEIGGLAKEVERGALVIEDSQRQVDADVVSDDQLRDDQVRDDQVRDDRVGDRVGEDRVGDDPAGDEQVGDDRVGSEQVGDDKVGDDKVGDDKVGDDKVGDEGE